MSEDNLEERDAEENSQVPLYDTTGFNCRDNKKISPWPWPTETTHSS
jgi:hypothetical protein